MRLNSNTIGKLKKGGISKIEDFIFKSRYLKNSLIFFKEELIIEIYSKTKKRAHKLLESKKAMIAFFASIIGLVLLIILIVFLLLLFLVILPSMTKNQTNLPTTSTTTSTTSTPIPGNTRINDI